MINYNHLIGRKIRLINWDKEVLWFKIEEIIDARTKSGEVELIGIDNLNDTTPVLLDRKNRNKLIVLVDFDKEMEYL